MPHRYVVGGPALDGSGYHRGPSAEDLDLPHPRGRPYHKALPQEKVLDILREEGATKLDSVALLEGLASDDAL